MHIWAGTYLLTLLFPTLLISCQFEKNMQQNTSRKIFKLSLVLLSSHENSTLQDFIEMILLRSTMKHQPSMKRSKNRSVKRDRKKALSVNKVPTLM